MNTLRQLHGKCEFLWPCQFPESAQMTLLGASPSAVVYVKKFRCPLTEIIQHVHYKTNIVPEFATSRKVI